jgi:integrase
LNHAIREELIHRNVVALVSLPSLRRPKRQRWSSEEARTFLESAKNDNDRLYAAYGLVLIMGLREGEVLGLPDEAINFETEELDISWQLARVQRQLLHRQTKTPTSNDTLPLIDIVTAALKLRIERRDRDREKAEAWADHGLLFTTEHGTPIEPRNFLRSWTARCAKAGVRYITVHDGQRSCGSLLADLDVHPRVAMRILRTRTSWSRWRSTRKSRPPRPARRSRSWATACNEAAAVLRCCTGTKRPSPITRGGPLTCCGP